MKQTDTTALMEGLYIKVENDYEVVDKFKFVRESFSNTILDSETHWVNRPIVPNQLKEGINIYCDDIIDLTTKEKSDNYDK